jgi:hypothetical protein
MDGTGFSGHYQFVGSRVQRVVLEIPVMNSATSFMVNFEIFVVVVILMKNVFI